MHLFRSVILPLMVCLPAAVPGAEHFDMSGYDRSVRIQDNLYNAVNGGWLKKTVIPEAKAEVYGVELPAIVDQRIRALVAGLAAQPQPAGSLAQKLGTYYAAYLDTDALDRLGIAPVAPVLAEINAIASVRELAEWQGRVQGRIATPVWLWGGFADFKNPAVSRPLAWQGGLGLPDRDYYLVLDDARMVQARAAYLRYLATLATLAGAADPAALAQRVMNLETKIALAHAPLAESRDPAKMYNPMSGDELATFAPGFDWSAFLRAAHIPPGERVVVTQAGTAAAIAALYVQVPLDDWKDYFQMRSLDEAAPVLPSAFRDAHFQFHWAALTGASAPTPRWQAGVEELDRSMGEALGRMYVARYFPPANKARVQAMVDNILAAYRSAISQCTWMTQATREQALDKLAHYKAKVGYPDQWRDYADLDVRQGDALGNRHRSRRLEWERKAAQTGKQIDGGAWMMTAHTVNAYYDPALNEIVLPAGLLQAPLFDMAADDAANYGAIGVQIAHEISHGFDNMGSQFDGSGVLRNWWSEADRKAFDAIGQRLSAQFSAYEPIPGKHVNGQLTLPENLADLGGLEIAFRAYRQTLRGGKSPVMAGRSGEQRFFLSFARSQRAKTREARLLQMLTSDPHAPNALRTIGPAVNVDGFHAAFGTKPGDAMYKAPDQRIHLWQ
jgi:putative endopeptidase